MIYRKKDALDHYRSVAKLIGVDRMADCYFASMPEYDAMKNTKVKDLVTWPPGFQIDADAISIAEKWV